MPQHNKKKNKHQNKNNGLNQKPKPTDESNDCIYKIENSEIMGRYLVAARNISPGETIIDEEPLAIGPGAESEPVCLGCYSPILIDDEQFRCPECKWPLCGPTCDGLGKPTGHTSWECAILKEKSISDKLSSSKPEEVKFFYELIFPLRILGLKSRDKDRYDRIMTMESHVDLRKNNSNLWDRYQTMLVDRLIKSWDIADYTEDEIHSVCGIIDVNCFEIVQNKSKARALFPNAFLLAHECSCNTSHSDHTGTHAMVIRASRNIKKGQMISLSYAYTLQGTYKRREYLHEGKLFWCSCPRCTDPTELGTNLSALVCSKCTKGNVLPTNPLDQTSAWKCDSCTNEMSSTVVVSLLEKLYNELESIDPHDIPAQEEFLKKNENYLAKNHYLLHSAKYSLCQVYGRTEGYLINELPNDGLRKKERYCRELLAVVNKLEPGLSRLRGLIMYELHAPIMVLASRLVATNQINKREFQRSLQEVVTLLKDSKKILQLEPEDSSEYIMAMAADDALKSMGHA